MNSADLKGAIHDYFVSGFTYEIQNIRKVYWEYCVNTQVRKTGGFHVLLIMQHQTKSNQAKVRGNACVGAPWSVKGF